MPSAATAASASVYLATIMALQARPQVEWLQPIRASGAQFANAVQADRDGNFYVTGYFAGEMEAGSETLSGRGRGDPFLLKYTAAGQVAWSRQGQGEGWSGGRGLAIDETGNVFLVGRFQAQLLLGGATLASRGSDDIFVAKYSPEGALLWARAGGGENADWGNDVAVDSEGSIYIAGLVEGPAEFDGLTADSSGDRAAIVVKYDRTGAISWLHTLGGPSIAAGYGIDVDPQGAPYLVSEFDEALITAEGTSRAHGETDGFVAKYSPRGDVLWIKAVGGSGPDVLESVHAASSVVYVAGSFEDSLWLDDHVLASKGGRDALLLQLQQDGGVRRARSFGSGGTDGFSGFGQSIDVAVTSNGDYWVASVYEGELAIDGLIVRSAGGPDLFIAGFIADGRPLSLESCAGSDFEGFVSLAAGVRGEGYVSANFNSTTMSCGGKEALRGDRRFGSVLIKVASPSAKPIQQ